MRGQDGRSKRVQRVWRLDARRRKEKKVVTCHLFPFPFFLLRQQKTPAELDRGGEARARPYSVVGALTLRSFHRLGVAFDRQDHGAMLDAVFARGDDRDHLAAIWEIHSRTE